MGVGDGFVCGGGGDHNMRCVVTNNLQENGAFVGFVTLAAFWADALVDTYIYVGIK